jgi:hypothetical protein
MIMIPVLLVMIFSAGFTIAVAIFLASGLSSTFFVVGALVIVGLSMFHSIFLQPSAWSGVAVSPSPT